MKKNFPKVILAVFPLLIILVGLLMLGRQTLHYTVHSDPEYFYLLNGLNIAQFKIISGNYIHPGIPLQYLSGIIVGVDYLISGKYDDIVTDVMLRPEHYILSINGTIVFLTGLIFFFSGWLIYKLTNNLAASLFLQSVPFIDQTGFFQLVSLVPEKLAFPSLFILIVLIIWYIKNNLSWKEERLLIVAFGFMVAFNFMQKLTMLPLIFAPFFLFRDFKRLKIYFISLGISTLIFFIPIIEHTKKMYEYFSGMATHSGYYGSGEKQVIDINSILPNLRILYRDHTITVVSFLVLLVFAIIISFSKASLNPQTKRTKWVIQAFAFSEMLMLLMLIKHFKSHYYAPTVALTFLNIYLVIEYIRGRWLNKFNMLFNFLYISLTLLLFYSHYNNINALFGAYNRQLKYEDQLIQVREQYKNMPKIILPRYYGTPFVEFSIYQAIYYSHNYEQFGETGKLLWPDSYFYTSEWGVYDMDYNNYKLQEVLQKYNSLLISYYDDDEAKKESFYKEIEGLNLKDSYTYNIVYNNDESKMVLLQMTKKDSLITNDTIYSIKWDMEKSIIRNTNPYYSFNINSATDQVYLSGTKSLLLDEKNRYGASIDFDDLKAGDIVLANVWRYGNGNNSGFVISDFSGKKLYKTGNTVTDSYNNWDKIEFKLEIPKGLNDEKLKIYLWQSDKSSPVYFDDIKVSIFRPKFPNDSIN